MNTQNFNQSGGFPIKTQTLDEMQKSWSVFNALGELSGNFTIISGCNTVGTTVSNGVVYINGEVLEFRGGQLLTTIIIVQQVGIREFKDGTDKDVVYTRFATFGVGLNQLPWANFKRGMQTIEIQGALDLKEDKTTITALLAKITALENKPSNIPVGLVAIWGGLFADIPEGWVEFVPLRGRTALGQNPDDLDFATVGSFSGAKTKTLQPNELPNPHNVDLYALKADGNNTVIQTDNGNATNLENKYLIIPAAANQPFSIMNPYRIVYYIKYTG